MNFKLFVDMADGDEEMLEFDTEREKEIFLEAIVRLKSELSNLEKAEVDRGSHNGVKSITINMKTTAQAQVLQPLTDIARKILGITTVNVYWKMTGQNEVVLAKHTK